MAGETIITIVGNLTADPETRTMQNGGTVCNFTIASTPRTFNRQSGQYEDGQALFLRCTVWRDLAAHCASCLAKGMRVIAQGRLQQRSYQAKDGTNRSVMELQVDEIGPSLRYATAQVHRVQHSNGFQQGGFTGGQQPQYGANPAGTPQQQAGDPWGSPAQGFQQGGTQTFGAAPGDAGDTDF